MSKTSSQTQSAIEILGVHPLTFTDEMVAEQGAILYGDPVNSETQRLTREQLESAVLIELRIHNPDRRFRVGDFTQKVQKDSRNNQAPWNEHFLTPDGTAWMSEAPDEVPAVAATWRLAFFLHFFKADVPLETSYGPIQMPAKSAMPARLHKLVPYQCLD